MAKDERKNGGRKRERRVPSLARQAGVAVLLLAMCAGARGEDVVIVAAGSNQQLRTSKRGTIVDFTGVQLRLLGSAGREELIPSDRVLEIRTQWTAAHRLGDELQQQGKPAEAVAAYRQAKREETRPWAVRMIMASLVEAYYASGQTAIAGDEFLGIVASDPTTQHYDVMPLAWRSIVIEGSLEARAATWLAAERFAAARLLGASWLLAGGRRTEAIAALEKLAMDADQRIAALAQMQLWRTRVVTASPADVQKWQALVEKQPAEIRAGGYFLIGEALARGDEHERAALAYLHVPLVHGSQKVLAADALLAAGKQLETLARPSQAAGLYREITTDYSACPAATEAAALLARLSSSASEPGAH